MLVAAVGVIVYLLLRRKRVEPEPPPPELPAVPDIGAYEFQKV